MTIQFWYEFASTYSYVAAARIEGIAAASGLQVEWRPFLLGPIFAESGWNDSPFNLYPVKGRYMWRDVARLCGDNAIPFKKPSKFPRNSLLAARVALIGESEGWCAQFTRAVFQANFVDDRDISAWPTIAEILTSLGRSADEVYELALAADNKDRLKRRTETAVTLGIFGAPTFVVASELFWGNDRLETAISWAKREAA